LLPQVTMHGHAKARGRATRQLGAALNTYPSLLGAFSACLQHAPGKRAGQMMHACI